ncbi:MAG: putative tRNA-dihydrouridine synthase [Spirochaetes bacterium ADurb.Bin269]|nr:MAG: putative tRNA-dihydrouridine synthase [Spirochaetes bacterium ADurb.Bin269]
MSIEERSLYHPVRIGALELPGNLFLAPVAGYSDRAFRSLCVECGASFTYTEMVSSEALVRSSGRTGTLMLRAPNETRYAVQLFGSEPERVADAARIVLETTTADCIDINAGCPVPKIWKTGAGSALTRDPEQLGRMVRTVVQTVSSCQDRNVPVTVKIRSGWEEHRLTWKEAALAAIEAGAAAVTLHPRTKAQGYEGTSRWDLLAELSDLVHTTHPGIPVFGSGDLFTPESARDMLSRTGCDAVMFARGAMGNPFIFTQTKALLQTGSCSGVSPQIRMNAGWRELLQLAADSGEPVACREMRKRFSAYSKGIEGGALLRTELVRASTIADYRRILEAFGFTVRE